MDWVHVGITSADAVRHGARTITPRSLVAWLRFPWPGGGYAFVFNHPISVVVQDGDAPAKTLPVINYNRLATFGIFLVATVAANILWSVFDGQQ
jgi:hypothetical protein